MKAKFFDKNRTEDKFGIEIDSQGIWHHKGQPISRHALSKLFATALHYDMSKQEYWLITPHEQGRIIVADVPYIITDFNWDNELILHSNMDHKIIPDKNNSIHCNDKNGLPYITVLNNAPARINRSVRDKLIDIALDQNGYNKKTKTLTLKANDHEHIIAIS